MPADASTTANHGLLSITTGLGFLRGGSSSPIKTRQKPSREEQVDIPTMSKDSLQIPQSSRLPLFGRSRKKSNASALSHYATESEAEETDNESRPRSMPLESTLPSQTSAHVEQDRQSIVSAVKDEPPSPTKAPSGITSLGAKLAARFSSRPQSRVPGLKTPSTPRGSVQSARAPSLAEQPGSEPAHTFINATRLRSSSIDSKSSNTSRSITPRPMITVSQPEKISDDFDDLFTKLPPKPQPSDGTIKGKSSASDSKFPSSSSASPSRLRAPNDKKSSIASPSASSSTSSQLVFPPRPRKSSANALDGILSESEAPIRASSSTTALPKTPRKSGKKAVGIEFTSDSEASVRAPSLLTFPRAQSRKSSSNAQDVEVMSESESSIRVPSIRTERRFNSAVHLSPNFSDSPGSTSAAQALQPKKRSSSPALLVEAAATASESARRPRTPSLRSTASPTTPPPTIPLPQTPESIRRTPSTGTSRMSTVGPASAIANSRSYIRPRAQTLTPLSPSSLSVQPSQVGASATPPKKAARGSLEKPVLDERGPDKENLDKESTSASIEQLRQKLEDKTQEFEDLRLYLANVVDKHAVEKAALERRIATLEKENIRKDKEIKGLTWLVANQRPGSSDAPSGIGLTSEASKSMSELSESVKPPSMPRAAMSPSPYAQAYDSGAESYAQLSGAETSGTESTSSFGFRRPKKSKLATPSSKSSNLARAISIKQLDDTRLSVATSSDKRSSLSSFTSSTSASSASSQPSSLSNLSSIPESSPPPIPPKAPPSPTPTSTQVASSRDPALVAAQLSAAKVREREQEAKKMAKANHRISAPVVASKPSPAASYAANLRKGRPPSIAQVLTQNHNPARSGITAGSTSIPKI